MDTHHLGWHGLLRSMLWYDLLEGEGGCRARARVRVRVGGRVRFRVWVRVGVRVRVGIRVVARVKGRRRVGVWLVVWSRGTPPTCSSGVPPRFADPWVLPSLGVAPMDLHLGCHGLLRSMLWYDQFGLYPFFWVPHPRSHILA